MTDSQRLLLSLAGILVLGVTADWLAWRLRLPSILLLLTVGFVVGPATGLIHPDDLMGDLLFPIVSLAVGIILFEGGLTLRLAELEEVGHVLRNLMTIGVAVTWALAAAGAYFLLDFPISTSLLLGAILVVTGPTVIGPLMRHVRAIGRVSALAKWEGIIVDPVGAVLAVLVFEAIRSTGHAGFADVTREATIGLLRTIVAGGVLGVVGAAMVMIMLGRYWIPDYLQSPVLLAVVVAVFTGANLWQHEAGLLASTVMGLILANQRLVGVKHIIEFKENLRVLLISSLFILLAARLEPSQFWDLGWQGIVFVVFLLIIVRPLSVLLSTMRSGLSWAERIFLSWMAPRGIVAASVASVFALGLDDSNKGLVPATFMVIVGTVAVYSLTAAPLARWLQLAAPDPQGVLIVGAHAAARSIARALQDAGVRVLLVDNNRANVTAARMEKLPTHYASIFSERALEEMDLGGIGHFMAVTSNDEVNSLAMLHLRDLSGRARVYQLAPMSRSRVRSETLPDHFLGRLLFGREVTYDSIEQRFTSGAIVKTTRLTKEFDYDAFRRRYGVHALPLFLVDDNGKLTVCTADTAPNPRAGQTLISLVEAEEPAAVATQA